MFIIQILFTFFHLLRLGLHTFLLIYSVYPVCMIVCSSVSVVIRLRARRRGSISCRDSDFCLNHQVQTDPPSLPHKDTESPSLKVERPECVSPTSCAKGYSLPPLFHMFSWRGA